MTFISEQPCPPVPYVDNGSITLLPDFNTSIPTHATLSCLPGYKFHDGRQVVNIACHNDVWYPEESFFCDRM